MSLTTIIRRELEARLKRVRFGFLAGPTSGDEGAHGQISAKPDYLDDAQQGIRRIAPPLLDVFPEVGARVAMLAQDGVPEYLAWVGQLWDENAPSMSAWLRAHLSSNPGHVELGATKSVTIAAGSERLTIEPRPDGTIRIVGTAKVIIDAPLVELGGEGLSSFVARADKVETRLTVLETWAKTHIHPAAGPLIPGPAVTTAIPTVPPPTTTPGSTACNRVKGD